MKVQHIPAVFVANPTLRVTAIDPQADRRWESFLAGKPASLIYHPAWLQVLEEIFGYKPLHLACEDASGQVVGILPLFYQQGWLSGRSIKSVFTGPLVEGEQAGAALLQGAVERTRAEPGVRLHLKMLSNAGDNLVAGLIGMPAYETYQLALPERRELLRLDSTIKRAVNKATRSGVEVRQAQNEGELCAWYQLYVQTLRKLGVLPYPYRYYKTIWNRLQSRRRLLLAEHVEAGQRRLLGGIFLLLYGQTVSFISAGWREEDQALRANDLLHWHAIQDGCAEGFRWYDFGNVDLSNQGLARYKRKWGAQAEMVYDYSYPVVSPGRSSNEDLSGNPVKQLLRQAWPRVPIKALGLLAHWYYALHLY